MEIDKKTRLRQLLGRWISIVFVSGAVILGLAVFHHAN
jgi:multidrug efflux system membrane fusion protein